MIYAYAFCPEMSQSLSLPTGIQGAAVQVVTVNQLSAIVEENIDVARLKEDDAQLMEAVLAHDRVLGHIFDQTPLLPLRFGTQFKDLPSVHDFLASHGKTYRQKLAALQNKAEYLIKLSPQPIAVPEIDSTLRGRDYFLAKKQRLRAQGTAQTEQVEAFQNFIATLESEGIPFLQSSPQDHEERLHVLLTRDAEQAQHRFQEWQKRLPTWQLLCSEPLPPYHFAA